MQRPFVKTNLMGKIPSSFTSSCHVPQEFRRQTSSEVWQSQLVLLAAGLCEMKSSHLARRAAIVSASDFSEDRYHDFSKNYV